MSMKRCPVCGVSVKLENLERHVKNQHPHDKVLPETLLTAEERKAATELKAAPKLALTRTGKRALVIVAVALVAVIVLAVVVTTWRSSGPGVGQNAPEFTLTTSGGGVVSLSQYRGQPILLEFMNTLCPACNVEAPILASLYQAYSTRVHFLSVDMAIAADPVNTAAEIEAFKTRYSTPWEYAIDKDGKVAGAYGVHGTPTVFIIDAKGVVAATPDYNSGGDSYANLAAVLNQLLG